MMTDKFNLCISRYSADFLIDRRTVPENHAITNSITALFTGIAAITFNGIDNAVFYFLNDTYVVGSAVTLPIKENNISCFWREAAVLPLSMLLKPCDTIRT